MKNNVDMKLQEVHSIEVDTNAKSYSKLGWLIVVFGVFGFLLWASFAPLDSGVPLSGNVAVSGNRKVIQHQTGGIVDEIMVKEGDVVKAGQVVIKMNSTQVGANFEITKAQLHSSQALEARLKAERVSAKKIEFPKALLVDKANATLTNVLFAQEQIFNSRQSALESELSAAAESVAGMQDQLNAQKEAMSSKKEQLALIKEQLTGVRELAKDGYVARNRLLELERTHAQLVGSIAEDVGATGRLARQISEIKLKVQQRQQSYQTEVRTQLAEAQKEIAGLLARYKALEFELNNALVRAPSEGTIVGLSVFTKGAVVPAGFKFMELVPQNEPYIIEGMLPTHLVDKVHPGLKVEMIFSAFNSRTTPHVFGEVTHVAADRALDEKTGAYFYRVKAKILPEGLVKLNTLQVRPGMPVEMIVTTGERTMMNYLLRPMLDRAKSSMKEE